MVHFSSETSGTFFVFYVTSGVLSIMLFVKKEKGRIVFTLFDGHLFLFQHDKGIFEELS